MGYAILLAAQLAGLLLIPFGLPGIWLQVAALGVYAVALGGVSPWVLGGAVVLGAAAELLEFWLGGRFARRYGGGRRAAWGAIAGAVVGAVIGAPIPILGSLVGSFVGAFVGAALFSFSELRDLRGALRSGWGGFLGRLAGIALKSGIGVAIAVISLVAALRWSS